MQRDDQADPRSVDDLGTIGADAGGAPGPAPVPEEPSRIRAARGARPLRALVHVALAGLIGFAVVDRVFARYDSRRDLREDSPLEFDPELVWVNRPGWNGTINSQGLRGPEIPADAPADELRVLGVGPSLVYGVGVDVDETWNAELERGLDARDDGPWRVLNGGVNGYSTVQSCRLALRLLDTVDPDLVLVFVEPGEVSLLDPSATQRIVPWRDRLAPVDLVETWPEQLLPARLALHDFLNDHSALYVRTRARGSDVEGRPKGIERFVMSRNPPDDPWVRDALERTFNELALLQRRCDDRGVELRVALVLHRAQYAGNRWTRYMLSDVGGAPPKGTKRHEPQQVLAEELAERGVASWNLYPVISTFGNKRTWTLEDGSHWSEEGHEEVAFGLLRLLDGDEGLVERMRAARRTRPRGSETKR